MCHRAPAGTQPLASKVSDHRPRPRAGRRAARQRGGGARLLRAAARAGGDRKPEALAARGGVWFACGAQQLHVGIAADFTPASKAHPALAASDLPALAERLTLAGAAVHWDDAIPGVQRFYTEDPWGNRLELVASG